jgi:CRISPR-associated protein (TIGR02584 family)
MHTTPNRQTAPKHVLISVVGLSPQVITETLYCYWCLASPPIPITEVFALTTLRGKQALEETLLGDNGQLKSLCSDYNLPPIRLDLANVHLLKDADGQPLKDISSVIDNEALADQLFAFVRKLATSTDICLHASIAGGRKTMGLYIGLAMQFYGRPGDTLSHVLVNPELENQEFFYPPPDGADVVLNDGRTIPATEIRLELAEIPLLLLREKIPFLKEHTNAGYTELIEIAQREYNALQAISPVIVNTFSCCLKIGEVTINLTPLELALYLFFARRHLEGQVEDRYSISRSDIREGLLTAALRDIVSQIPARDFRLEGLKGWENDPIARFSQTRSNINRKIRERLDDPQSTHYQIQSWNPSSNQDDICYGLALAKDSIQF